MSRALVTGGSGFFGGILKRRLLALGWDVVSLDLIPDGDRHERLTSVVGDVRVGAGLGELFAANRLDAVFHCAAMLAHDRVSAHDLWSSNVDGTRRVAEACAAAGVGHLVFISSNCLWAHDVGHEVAEDEPPAPAELYGRSKLAAEEVLREFPGVGPVVIRCPTIIDEGRLGLLAILFAFIEEGRRVWVVGDGSNRYQFIYAEDLVMACVQALLLEGPELFHIGSDHVSSLRQVYEAVIAGAGTRARVASLPRGPALGLMRAAHLLGVSPLGPYHYRMIAENFVFDTRRIKQRLGWQPTLNNEEMMLKAFRYYHDRKGEIHARTNVSAHSKPATMGIIRLLKWIS